MARASITEPLIRVLSRCQIRAWAGLSAVVVVSSLATVTSATAPVATGRIEGTVRLVAPPGAPIPSGAYPARRVSPRPQRASEISNVVVFVKDAPRARLSARIGARADAPGR